MRSTPEGDHTYASLSVSVSSAVRFSADSKSARERPRQPDDLGVEVDLVAAQWPRETRSTTPPLTANTSCWLSVSSAVQCPLAEKTSCDASADAPPQRREAAEGRRATGSHPAGDVADPLEEVVRVHVAVAHDVLRGEEHGAGAVGRAELHLRGALIQAGAGALRDAAQAEVLRRGRSRRAERRDDEQPQPPFHRRASTRPASGSESVAEQAARPGRSSRGCRGAARG